MREREAERVIEKKAYLSSEQNVKQSSRKLVEDIEYIFLK